MSREEYMRTMDAEVMDMMVSDWYDPDFPEHQDLTIDRDSARYDSDIERWVMDARDGEGKDYYLVAEYDGNIYIR